MDPYANYHYFTGRVYKCFTDVIGHFACVVRHAHRILAMSLCGSVWARGQCTVQGITDKGRTHSNECIRYELEWYCYD